MLQSKTDWLVLHSKSHDMLRSVMPLAKKILPKYWKQAEAISLEGSPGKAVKGVRVQGVRVQGVQGVLGFKHFLMLPEGFDACRVAAGEVDMLAHRSRVAHRQARGVTFVGNRNGQASL